MDNYTIFDFFYELLFVNPAALLGAILITVLICVLKLSWSRKIAVLIPSLLLFYYLAISLDAIFGIATIGEFRRLISLGEGLIHPQMEWLPLADGFSAGFIANIFVFIPIGFLIPFMSRNFEKMVKTVLLGSSLSLAIEISQIFTLYRATDINDLLTNTFGTLLGWCCFKMATKLFYRQSPNALEPQTRYLPIIVVAIAFLNVFFLF